MEYISLETLENFCRTCLKQIKRQKFNIQSLDLQIQQWLQDVTLDNPVSTDTYPNSICRTCLNKLKDLLDFRHMCVRSRKKIGDILKSKNLNKNMKNITEEDDVPKEFQMEHFLRIDMFEDQDIKLAGIKNEPEITKINFLTDGEEKSTSSIKLYQSEDENSYSDSYIPNCKQDCSTLDESSNEENSNKKYLQNANKTAAKKKKYIYKFRCDLCKYRAVSQQTLDIHKRTHLGLKPFQCSQCDQAFDKSIQMLKHLNEFHGEKLTIVCEYEDCGRKFKSTRSYKEHYRQNHIEEEESLENTGKPNDKEPHKHVCEECGKIYTKLQIFKEHKYTHGPKELYPFQCTECDKAFTNPRTFKEHQQRHAGIRNFECSYCGAKKTTKKELRSHINSHTKEKKYPCPNCPLIFYRTTNLRVHVEVVHQGIRRFACRYCDQTFGKGDNLKHHELLHTGEKPHECKDCGKRFVQKVSLRLHMKTHIK